MVNEDEKGSFVESISEPAGTRERGITTLGEVSRVLLVLVVAS